MRPVDDLDSLERDELRELYAESLEHLRYQHEDVWKGQKYFTTLNTAIIGGALTLSRLDSVGGLDDIRLAPFFLIGTVVSLVGYKVVRRLRYYYLQAATKKTAIECLLGYRQSFTGPEGVITSDLAVTWKMGPDAPHEGEKQTHLEDLSKILSDEWARDNVYNFGGVTFWLISLNLFFCAMNALFLLYVLSTRLA